MDTIIYIRLAIAWLLFVQAYSAMIKGPFEIVTKNLTIVTDPAYFVITRDMRIDKQPNEMNITINVMQDIEQPLYIQGYVGLVLPNNQPQTFIKGKWLEVCKFYSKSRQDLVLDILFRMLNDYGNTLCSCPMVVMQSNITGMQLKSSYLPSFVPSSRYIARATFAIKVAKNYNAVSTWTWTGEIRR